MQAGGSVVERAFNTFARLWEPKQTLLCKGSCVKEASFLQAPPQEASDLGCHEGCLCPLLPSCASKSTSSAQGNGPVTVRRWIHWISKEYSSTHGRTGEQVGSPRGIQATRWWVCPCLGLLQRETRRKSIFHVGSIWGDGGPTNPQLVAIF